HNEVFSSVFAYQRTRSISLTIHDQTAPATGEYVSGTYFRSLGIVPAAGRWLVADDDRLGGPSVAVISSGLAAARFGGSGTAVGQTVLLNNAPFTVVGVTPREFFGTDPGVTPDVYVTLHAAPLVEPANLELASAFHDPTFGWLGIMGRLQ